MMRKVLLGFCLLSSVYGYGQQFLQVTPEAQAWVDKESRKLSRKEKIAQLMVIRLSEKQGGKDVFFEEKVTRDIKKYNIGALCLFQGNAVTQAQVVNRLQAIAKTPLMVTIDGETGVGMRYSDVEAFPNELTIGATSDPKLAYEVGAAIAKQCVRSGIHVNYAPVVDINNNPLNPVINVRSFGEDRKSVSDLGIAIMKGMQDGGVMACAKHFPGHGDVSVDSHYDLPVILKSRAELDALELYPFKEITKAGVGSMMMGHLYIPAIDSTKNQASSLSPKNVTSLLRNEVGFKGLTFTDALEMKGVAKFYPQGEAATQSIIAGNDMLCLPGDIKGSIKNVRKAIRKGKLTWDDINTKVDRVLIAKYNLGLSELKTIDTANIVKDLNKDVAAIKAAVYGKAITIVKQAPSANFDLTGKKVAYVGLGIDQENRFSQLLNATYHADAFYVSYKDSAAVVSETSNQIKDGKYDAIIIGVHAFNKYPVNNFGISKAASDLLASLQQNNLVVNFVFGTPYMIKNMEKAAHIIACYEDDAIMQETAVKLLQGTIKSSGKLPVTVSSEITYGTGLLSSK
jgi:beta-N-acetylhexosaminidase